MENDVSLTNFTLFNSPIGLNFQFSESEPFSSNYGHSFPELYSLHHRVNRKETEYLSESPPPGIQEHVSEFTKPETLQLGDRLLIAIEYLKEYLEDTEILIQIWTPINKGSQNVLTTIDQPYLLNSKSGGSLDSYRNVSERFYLTTEEDSREFAGLPGRVFSGKFPEWTPDVRYFRSDECPRKNYAKMYNISGCLALPVFDHQNVCLAVVEIVTTFRKISYNFEIQIVCKALEAVDLRSWPDFFPLSLKANNELHQVAVPELSETLQFICQTFKLPLAQTWTLHECQFTPEFPNSYEKFGYCISTVESACYVADDETFGFHEACSEQCLFLNQGIVGKAFATNEQHFSPDITSFSKTNYPLSHHARMFSLGAALAIPLQNIYTGLVQFVLEIFLPRDCKDIEQQNQMRDLLPFVIQQGCPSFRVVMESEINNKSQVIPDCGLVSWEFLKEEPEDQGFSGFKQIHQNSVIQNYSRAPEKRQNKIEKMISLQVLRQYFAGSLKDAAKSIGVCPTTLKRICRKYGINRWPSRKIKKVNHSLKKLQLVVDSINGAEGLIQIKSFYETFPVLNPNELPQKDPKKTETEQINPKSQSFSGSQNSGSSICCSTEAMKLNNNAKEETSETRKTSEMNHKTSQTEQESPKNASGLRVKASFGQEHIRLHFLEHWSLNDLKREIVKRFRIDDFRRIDLKYLDIDNESVLLTCDADLEECIDLLRFSRKTIKISVHEQQIRPN